MGEFKDAKWNTTLNVTVLLMEVTKCDDDWLEAGVRQRRWFDAERAAELLAKKALRRLVDKAVERIECNSDTDAEQ